MKTTDSVIAKGWSSAFHTAHVQRNVVFVQVGWGYLLHLLFLLCGMHGLKPFNILWIYPVLQILCWCLLWSQLLTLPNISQRMSEGLWGLWCVWSLQWHLAEKHTHIVYKSRWLALLHCFGFGGKHSPVDIWNYIRNVVKGSEVQGFNCCLLRSKLFWVFRLK